jgi:hypothetical protein
MHGTNFALGWVYIEIYAWLRGIVHVSFYGLPLFFVSSYAYILRINYIAHGDEV